MKELARILAAFQGLDATLEATRANASLGMAAQVEARQVLNDQAYFLLCWGQLELAINERCRDAIRRRRNDPDWAVRRGWDLYNPDDPRLSGLTVEERARLVLDQKEGRGSPFARTLFHYTVRNEIAHGGLPRTRIDVSAFVLDCYVIQGALHRAL